MAQPKRSFSDPASGMRAAAQLQAQGRPGEAERLYREIAERRPDYLPVWGALADAALLKGDLAEAHRLTEHCVAVDPGAALQWRNLCELRRLAGAARDAIAAGRRATQLTPADPDAWHNLSLALGDAGQIADAIAAASRLLDIAPAHGSGWNNLGHWLARAGRLEEAHEAFRRALALAPDNPQIRRNLVLELIARARRLWLDGRQERAMALLDEALAHDPENVDALGLRGTCLADLADAASAMTDIQRALALAPGDPRYTLTLAACQIQLGMWKEGWKNYEARYEGAHEVVSGTRSFPKPPLPPWTGQSGTEGQSILILCEQGFGDTIQFSRFLALLRPRFARVALLTSRELLRLMEAAFGDEIAVIPGFPCDYAGWDWHCHIMSLPFALGVEVDTLPRPRAYLRLPERAVELWGARLAQRAKSGLKVGLSWKGRPDHRFNRDRSMTLAALAPLLAVEGVAFVSLQQQDDGRVETPPSGAVWIDWMPEMGDFAATAALIANLDLVIGIDGAIVHLAGALGIPVWMMDRHNSEWRWMAPRLDSPWYPTMRIFRQSRRGQWDDVIAGVVEALKAERGG